MRIIAAEIRKENRQVNFFLGYRCVRGQFICHNYLSPFREGSCFSKRHWVISSFSQQILLFKIVEKFRVNDILGDSKQSLQRAVTFITLEVCRFMLQTLSPFFMIEKMMESLALIINNQIPDLMRPFTYLANFRVN